jgi:predicted alternative tryptophan synthase beta-subunit
LGIAISEAVRWRQKMSQQNIHWVALNHVLLHQTVMDGSIKQLEKVGDLPDG